MIKSDDTPNIEAIEAVNPEGDAVIKPHITIYPDFGTDAWYWINYSGTDSIQGGIPKVSPEVLLRKVPKKLMEDFHKWHLIFNKYAFEYEQVRRPFDWKSFHYSGIQLSVRLKQAVKEDIRVFYEKPLEDPNHHLNERREVLADGQLI